MKFLAFIAALLLPVPVLALEQIQAKQAFVSESPNRISRISGTLQPSGKGSSVLLLDNGVTQNQVELAEKQLFFKPEVRWFGEDFVHIKFWTAPGKSTSLFYDVIKDRLSVEFPGVLAVDGGKMVAANVDKNRLRLVKIFGVTKSGFYFGGNSIALDGNFPKGKPLLDVIKKSEFTPQGDFLMRYEVGAKVQMGVRVSNAQISF